MKNSKSKSILKLQTILQICGFLFLLDFLNMHVKYCGIIINYNSKGIVSILGGKGVKGLYFNLHVV